MPCLDGLVVAAGPRSRNPGRLAMRQHDVHRNAMQPGAERRLRPELRQLFPHPHEHILRELLGERAIRQHAGTSE